jgi:CheY-like chemotaxis protein
MENNLAGSRILIVEDESPLRLILAELLSDEGFAITEAESGDQAIELLTGYETFDLVFTDNLAARPGRRQCCGGLSETAGSRPTCPLHERMQRQPEKRDRAEGRRLPA